MDYNDVRCRSFNEDLVDGTNDNVGDVAKVMDERDVNDDDYEPFFYEEVEV